MKNKNGFISMSLVYSYLLLFLFIMLAIINAYSEKNKFLSSINELVDNNVESISGDHRGLLTTILEDNTPKSINNLGSGLYYIDGVNESKAVDSTRIYFYRGNVTNNYAVFAGNCYRIVRTNEDNSVRLAYFAPAQPGAGSGWRCPTVSVKYGSSVQFNSSYDSNTYVGYMYGNNNQDNFSDEHYIDNYNIDSKGASVMSDIDNSSNLKKAIDAFYNSQIKNYGPGGVTDFYEKYTSKALANAIYCSNRTRLNVESGYGKQETSYSGNMILNGNITPSFTCDDSDQYQLSIFADIMGNRIEINSLMQPIATLTATDVYYAADGINNANHYLNYGYSYWTMTPAKFTGGKCYEVSVTSTGTLGETPVNSSLNYVPVISLSATTNIQSGFGTNESPYVIGLE